MKRYLYGWQRSDAKTYGQCFRQFGGSVNVHPDVLDVITGMTGAKIDYFHYEKCGRIVAAYPLLNGTDVGANVWRHYPFSYDEVRFPMEQSVRLLFPEKSNRLAGALSPGLLNVNTWLARKNRVCLARDRLSSKSEKNRRNEYSRFLRAGGRCVEQTVYCAEELAEIYVQLFNARFAGLVACYDKNTLTRVFRALRHLIFGHVMLAGDEPCAFDLVWCAESEQHCYFDVPNGGVDPRFARLSPGSLLMWQNIQLARRMCAAEQKQMIFSLGALDENWSYKLRWASAQPTGKTLF